MKHAVPFVGCAGCHAGHADVFFAVPAVRARDAGGAKGQARRTRDPPGFATCPFSRSADHQWGRGDKLLVCRGCHSWEPTTFHVKHARRVQPTSTAGSRWSATRPLGERPSDGGYAYRRAATAAWSASRGAVVGVCSAWD